MKKPGFYLEKYVFWKIQDRLSTEALIMSVPFSLGFLASLMAFLLAEIILEGDLIAQIFAVTIGFGVCMLIFTTFKRLDTGLSDETIEEVEESVKENRKEKEENSEIDRMWLAVTALFVTAASSLVFGFLLTIGAEIEGHPDYYAAFIGVPMMVAPIYLLFFLMTSD